MTRRRRKTRTPSTGHKLAALVLSQVPINRTPATVTVALEEQRAEVSNLAGIYGADWAIRQLATPPHVAPGWPAPPKAARMKMPNRKAASK